MLRVESVRHESSEPTLVVAFPVAGERDREGLHPAAGELRHEGRDRGRVEAAAQQNSKRYFAHEMTSGRRHEPLVELVDALGLGQRDLARIVQVPVLLLLHHRAACHQDVAGFQLLNTVEHGQRGNGVVEGEIVVERLKVHAALDRVDRQQRPNLRAEREEVGRAVVVERLDAEAISREDQAARLLVPDSEREHSLKPLDTSLAHLFVQVDDHLRIAPGLEEVPLGEQLLPEIQIVVDLAVVGDPHCSVFVAHRLVSGCQIDDAQPAGAERDRSIEIDAVVVRSAMGERLVHRLDEIAIRQPTGIVEEDSVNPAHGSSRTFGPADPEAPAPAPRPGFFDPGGETRSNLGPQQAEYGVEVDPENLDGQIRGVR